MGLGEPEPIALQLPHNTPAAFRPDIKPYVSFYPSHKMRTMDNSYYALFAGQGNQRLKQLPGGR